MAIALGIGALVAPARAAFLLRTPLSRTAGEDPSVSAACPAAGDARWDGTLVRASLTNMDPARFPAATLCQTEIRVGAVTSKGIAFVLAPSENCLPAVDVTTISMQEAGTAKAGDKALIKIKCTVGGVRHQTQWAGTF
ncbi:MAG TPA: hypothetical protein VLI07_01595 [Candidatus Binatus sp.]|nr:hypothetical protein [Candidatus Binatus sp.]